MRWSTTPSSAGPGFWSSGPTLLAVLAFLGVLTFCVLPGVVIGVVFALAILVEHLGRPPSSTLRPSPEGTWHDVGEEEPSEETVGGLVAYRQESPVVLVNARRVSDRFCSLSDDVDVIVFDATAISTIDSTGFSTLITLRNELEEKGVELWTVNPSARKSALFDEETKILGITLPHRFQSLDDVLAVYTARSSSTSRDSGLA